MALILSGTHSSGPGLMYELYADQTGGSGNSRTVKLTLKLKCSGSSSSWYGYPMNHRFNVNGSWSSYYTTKGTESWNGGQAFRTYEYTATTDVGTTSSKSITVGFQTDSYSGDNSWDTTKTGSFTVGSTNVAPVLSGTIATSPSGTFSEKTTQILITSPVATDGNGNLSGYRFAVSVNGGGYTELAKQASREYRHNITAGEGNTYKYSCYAYDASGANSATIYSNTITQNTFKMDSFSSSSSISWSGSPISFSYSGGSNTQSGVSISRKITCNGITIHNNTVSASPFKVGFNWGQPGGTDGAYINWSDIEAKFKNSTDKGIGTLTFTLTSTNSNGTAKTATKTINVNLQSTPNAVSGQVISEVNNGTVGTESTCYQKVGANWYFLPDGTKVVRVKWNAATGNLGEACKYKVYVAYGGSSTYSWVADVASGTLYYNHKVPKQSVQQQIKYRIESISTYNESNKKTADTPAKTLDYYNSPGITLGTISRFSNSAEVNITVKTLTSITNVETRGTYTVWKQGTTKPTTKTGDLGITQNQQTITAKGLTEADKYYMAITYYDNTGLSTSKALSPDIAIGQSLPVMFVNDYGIGVGGRQATSSTALNVNGKAVVSDLDVSSGITNKMRLKQGFDVHSAAASSGTTGYLKVAKITISNSYQNAPLRFTVAQRGRGQQANLFLTFSNANSNNPSIASFIRDNGDISAWAYAVGSGVYEIYIQKTEGYDRVDIVDFKQGNYLGGTKVVFVDEYASTIPSGAVAATKAVNVTTADINAIGAESGSYWGMTTPSGSNNSWIRTTSSGLIPNTSNGAGGYGGGSLGTSSWRFENVFGYNGNFSGGLNAAGTVLGRDTLTFADNSVWKSIDFTRSGGTVRFGIGSNADGPSPSIEYKPSGGISGANEFRLDICKNAVRTYSTGGDVSNWYGFYSGSTRIGYIGRGTTSNEYLMWYAERGAAIIRGAYSSNLGVVLDSGNFFRPESNNNVASGHSSYRWSTVYYTNLNAASDEKLKENVKYVSENDATPYNEETAVITTKDCYDFVKDDLHLATYDYKTSVITSADETSRMKDKLGFIAQDIVNTKVGSFIVSEDEVKLDNTFTDDDIPGEVAGEHIENPSVHIPSLLNEGETTLTYDLTDYVNVLAGALKTAINEIETLKARIIELEGR